jgi:RND family efflux transporter MFP subunit
MTMPVSLSRPAATNPHGWRGWRLLCLSLLIPGAPFLVAGCDQAPAGPPRKAPEVIVTTPVRGEVVDYQDFTGRLDGFRTVDIRAHVSGYIMEAPFQEGDPVNEGDLLFLIDQRPFKAALNQAEANLKVAVADRNLQARNAARARIMIESKSIAREDYDAMIATDEKARATVGALEAARDQAQLNLVYTRVIAPISGRISRRNVDPGNLVTADNTSLTTLVSDRQLYAYFDVDERTYLNLVASVKPGQSTLPAALQFPVLMSLANEGDRFEHVGKVNFIDNRVNATSGTIRMRGVFDNASGGLKSGLFVRIRLPLSKQYSTLFVAGEALQSDQGRDFVYVVNDDKEVVRRYLTVGQEVQVTVGKDVKGLREVKDGLREDERVIVGGLQRVRERDRVEIKTALKPPKPPVSPLVPLLAKAPQPGTAAPDDKGPAADDGRAATGKGRGPARPAK